MYICVKDTKRNIITLTIKIITRTECRCCTNINLMSSIYNLHHFDIANSASNTLRQRRDGAFKMEIHITKINILRLPLSSFLYVLYTRNHIKR